MTLYRRVVVVEILADEDPADWDLAGVAYQTLQGGASGTILADATSIVDDEAMRGLLIAQNSDPEFLGVDL